MNYNVLVVEDAIIIKPCEVAVMVQTRKTGVPMDGLSEVMRVFVNRSSDRQIQ